MRKVQVRQNQVQDTACATHTVQHWGDLQLHLTQASLTSKKGQADRAATTTRLDDGWLKEEGCQ